MRIFWDEPFTGGSAITGYIINIRMSDGISYAQDLVDCNGANSQIVSTRQCIIPVTTVRNLPYELEWESGVYANV